MNLDLGQVRAFLAVADSLHFGRAAAGLHLTQQGLSHRITRLERALGQQMFARTARGVELTPAGQRFLPRARELLTTAQAAFAEVGGAARPLRVDVWGQFHAPLRWIRRRELDAEITMRRSTMAAVDALMRDEIDVAFGRLPDAAVLYPALHARHVHIAPAGVLLADGHPLAAGESVRTTDLAAGGLWMPSRSTAPEIIEHVRAVAAHIGAELDETGINLGFDHILAGLAERPAQGVLAPLDMPVPPGCGLVLLPLTDPTPMYPWTMIHRAGDEHPGLAALQSTLDQLRRREGWLEYDPARHWLPPVDAARLKG